MFPPSEWTPREQEEWRETRREMCRCLSPAELVEWCRRLGALLYTSGGQLRAKDADLVFPELREEVRLRQCEITAHIENTVRTRQEARETAPRSEAIRSDTGLQNSAPSASQGQLEI